VSERIRFFGDLLIYAIDEHVLKDYVGFMGMDITFDEDLFFIAREGGTLRRAGHRGLLLTMVSILFLELASALGLSLPHHISREGP
jgi:hypothetical protein